MILTYLMRLFGRTIPPRPDLNVMLYTRLGCHLCDDAWEVLTEAQRSHGFQLKSIDVDSAPELVEQYGQCVPVVLVNGTVRFRGRVNRVLLQRILEKEPRV